MTRLIKPNYGGVRSISYKGTGNRRRFVFSLSPRGTIGEGRGEGKALKKLPENDLVFPWHPSPLPSPLRREREFVSQCKPSCDLMSRAFQGESGRIKAT
jgi:hypothetical protein